MAAADGVTLNTLKLAALALKRGDEAEARRLLVPICRSECAEAAHSP
ncbi:MAG: hypothetical protein M3552_07225 [Planctomycetota bacterium]|nr:hypothetical protein [Planctomycetaceae bacterium]MDQ3330428.1 hypothetical protein [Planctomycetota bacterium]